MSKWGKENNWGYGARKKYFAERLVTMQMDPLTKKRLYKHARRNKKSVSELMRIAVNNVIDMEIKDMNNWKDFVVKLCELGATNTSQEIADVINKNGTETVGSRQVAAVKANWKMGRYA